MKCFVYFIFVLQPVFACTLSESLQGALEDAARTYGLAPALLEALVWQESGYCVDARSPKGAIGLGQLMPATAAELGVNPYDAKENLLGAAAYLRAQWDTFGDWNLALAAYNAGPGAVIKSKGIPINGETEVYVPSVLEKYSDLMSGSIYLESVPIVDVKPVSLAVLRPQTGGLHVYSRDQDTD